MNIYKVVFTGCDYDEYDSFVVAAESAFGAEQLVKGLYLGVNILKETYFMCFKSK